MNTGLLRLPLAVSMGDALGIGPEIIVRAFAGGALGDAVVYGSAQVLQRAGATQLAQIQHPSERWALPPGVLPLIEPAGLPAGLAQRPWGTVHADAGRAAVACIEAAVADVQAGQAAALVTAPIHKEALAASGCPHPGHTELLQALATPAGAEPPPVRMMLANDELRVVLVTIHVSLRQALAQLDFDAVLSTLRIAHRAVQGFGVGAPRLAVAGLNPHAGEGGLFGDEELRFIAPAVRAARAEGIDACGPLAPDTVFMRARRGEFDAVVSMLHDHGLIAVKYLGVEQGVNVTLGLPFVRTSPDHGTAFDIAGRGLADDASLRAALAMARRLCRNAVSAPPGG